MHLYNVHVDKFAIGQFFTRDDVSNVDDAAVFVVCVVIEEDVLRQVVRLVYGEQFAHAAAPVGGSVGGEVLLDAQHRVLLEHFEHGLVDVQVVSDQRVFVLIDLVYFILGLDSLVGSALDHDRFVEAFAESVKVCALFFGRA